MSYIARDTAKSSVLRDIEISVSVDQPLVPTTDIPTEVFFDSRVLSFNVCLIGIGRYTKN